MAIKPFEIQGSTLTIGGVDLEAGTTGVVIPGVTQASNYFVEEVDERDGVNPDIFGSDEGAVTVIDNAEYLYLVDDGDTPSADYVAATYSVDSLDDGQIEEINVESAGVFLSADKTRVEAGNMWATTTPTPFVSFNSANWTEIPYRPKMRAGDIENVGGGNANTGNFTFSDDTISNDNDASIEVVGGSLGNIEVNAVDEQVPPGGIWRLFISDEEYPTLGTTVEIGDTVTTSWGTPITATITDIQQDSGDWKIHVAQDITAGFDDYDTVTFNTVVTTKTWTFGQDGSLTLPNGMSIDSYGTLGENAVVSIGGDDTRITIDNNGAPPGLTITTNATAGMGQRQWRFGPDGDLTFPDGTTQTTAYTGDGAAGTFFVVANDDGRVSKSTDGVTWTAGVDTGAGIDRVATDGVTVAMIQSSQLSWTTFAGLESSTYVSGASNINDQIGGRSISWNQIDYAGGYFVAVGSYTPIVDGFTQGVYGYSTDGQSWTFATVDQTVVEFFGNDPVDSNWEFSDVDYNGVGWMFSVSDNGPSNPQGGGVYITDLTAAVTSARCFSMSLTYDAAWNGSAWYMEGDNSLAGVNTNLDPRDGTFDGPIDPWDTDIQDLGIGAGSTNELAGGNGYIAASDSDGHVAWSDDNGATWQIVTPIPYTRTISAITQASPAVVSFSGSGSNGNSGEKVVISGSSVSGYNGTFYWNSTSNSLYTDQTLTTEFDTTGLAPFTGTATLTWSHGEYIDAMDYINGYFYIGNDDEQIARTTNFVSWTIVDDQNNDFEYWNDIAGFVNTGGNANTGNFTFDQDTITNGDGLILSTDRGTLAIGTNMETPGVAGHFHIGFDGSNSEANANDLFLGDDYNYVKLPGYELNADDFGIEIGTHDRDGGDSHVWRFETDGGLKFPDGTTQTTAYTGQGGGGGGTTTSNVWVQTFETATPATDVPQVALSVEYDSDGNIIALFSHVSPETDSTYYSVGKYTTTGIRIWTTRFAGDFFTDGWGLAVDNAGGFVYIAGRISADGGQDNATLTKISGVTGLVEWSKKYDFGYNSSSAVVDVNAEGDPVMVGFAEGEVDRYVTTTKIDQTDGSIIWSRALDGQGDEQAYGMAVGPSSEVVAVGSMTQLGDSSDTDDNMVVVKYNTEGVIQWQRAILFDEGFNSTGSDADIDSEGNIYVCGQFETTIDGPINQLMCIVKFDSMGVKQWSRRVEGNCGAFSSSIVVGADDHLYLVATTFAGTENTVTDIHLVLAKYEFDGTVAWQRLLDYTPGYAFGSSFFGGDTGGSNLAVTQDYVAVGFGFAGGSLFEGPGSVNAAIAQIPASGNVFTVGNWDFKSASFTGTVNSTASDILVDDADKTDYDNIASININTVTLEEDSSNFLIGTLVTAPGGGNELVNGVHVFALESDGTLTLDGDPFTGSGSGFTVLADGTLQANTDSNTTTLSSLLTSKPTWLTITPRSPDRNTLDTHYGFTSSGMWFTGNNEETRLYQPAYPIHTTDSFPADVKIVVEFDINLVSGQEDWGVCVYPADGVPHWNWDPHPSRIAATIDCDDEGSPVVALPEIYGFYNSNSGPNVFEVSRARFTYDPVAELTTLELFNNDVVVSRAQLPGRLARDQDYRIGFDADWDEAGVGDKSYFYNLLIESGNTTDAKATELTVTGELKLPNTVKGFVNMVGPWANSDDDIQFQSVAAHDGYAYMIGEAEWSESNRIRIDKYSLTSGELVWTRLLGAGRNAEFDISWTGGAYTLTNIANNGIGYQVGQLVYISGDQINGGQSPDNLVTITITDVDDEGDIVTATIAGTAPSGTDSQTGLTEYNSDGRGDPTSIKYDTVTDTLVLLTAHYTAIGDADDTNWDRALVTRINPVSGDVVSTVTLSDEGDIYPYDVAVHPTTGATAVVGEKRNEYRAFGTLTMLAKGNEYFDILKSNLDAEHYPGSGIPGEYPQDYWIAGTGIANKENVDNVNYYANLTSTTRQGTGAEFNITNNGDGTYSAAVTAAVTTNYRVGHKIKVLGTALGGATPDNDAIITVTAVTSGVIDSASISGTAAGTTVGTDNGVSGTNYQVGSGLTVAITVDAVTGSRIANISLGGSNYVTNDVFVIPGTQFANGATPANDVEVTIVGIGEAGGNVTSVVTAGTTPTNAIRVLVAGVDFTGAGSWTMTQNLLGEAFVWTAAWNKAIGGGSNDQFQSVVYSKDGTSIYAVGSGSYEVTHRQSLVVKFATSDGTIGFSKYLNSDTVDSYATGVATIGTSDIVVAGFERNTIIGIDRDQQFVARLTSSGTVVWKKFYGDGNWGNSIDNNCDIQVDSDNNIYVTMQEGADNPSFSNNGFHVTKLDQAGNLVWTRCVSGSDSSYLTNWNGNRFSSLANDQLVVAGYTYVTDDEYYNGLWASFPTDGFTYFGGEDDFVQQGAFRISQGRLKNGVSTLDTGGSFTPSVQAPTITASNNLKKYETREPLDFFEQHLHKMVDPKHGGLVFGDGSRQTFATDTIPQIKADNDYTITAQDSGKHIYLKNNSGTITIPAQDSVNPELPVGFTFTIINRTGSDCFVRLYDTEGPTRGTILGAGRNSSYYEWAIPDSGSGSMVTLIKLESLQTTNEGDVTQEPVWMISGPGDIYVTD